jgi:hypothetical protein
VDLIRILISMLLITFVSAGHLFADPSEDTWVVRHDGPGNAGDKATSLAVDDQGNVYVTGWSPGDGTGSDYATMKYDPEGNELWVKRYNGPGNAGDEAASIVVDDWGNVYVTGWSEGDGTWGDYATVKYDAEGNELWVKSYNGQGNGWDKATSLAVDDQGNVYVTGWSWADDSKYDYATVKYDMEGNELWVKPYDGPGNSWDEALSLVVDDWGNVYVTGWSEGDGTWGDYATVT